MPSIGPLVQKQLFRFSDDDDDTLIDWIKNKSKVIKTARLFMLTFHGEMTHKNSGKAQNNQFLMNLTLCFKSNFCPKIGLRLNLIGQLIWTFCPKSQDIFEF